MFIILQTIFPASVVLIIGEYESDNTQSCDAFRPIAWKRKYLMDYNHQHSLSL